MLVLAAPLLLHLAGCANVPKQAFNREAHTDIVVIGLIEPPVTDEYGVVNLGHPGMGFGLIGGLIAAADIQGKTDEFTKQMRDHKFDAQTECRDALANSLKTAGYRPKIIVPKRTEKKFLDSYDDLDTSVDAYFDVICSAGYVAAGPATPYVPSVTVNVRMIKRSTREIVYQDVFSYGYENRFLQAINVTAETQYHFPSFEALTTGNKKALEGMRTGIPLLARRLAQDISRSHPPAKTAGNPASPIAQQR